MCKQIDRCRICESRNLQMVLDLGTQHLTGVFPASDPQSVTAGPLVLVKCDRCGLVQLQHSFNSEEMYGDNYGYRSGLNASMVEHLGQKARQLQELIPLS